MDALELPVDVEFSIHAASLAIQNLDRVDLEEAFIEMLHQKLVVVMVQSALLGVDAPLAHLVHERVPGVIYANGR